MNETQQTLDLLNKRIQALKTDLALELDGERRVILQERVRRLEVQRREFEANPRAARRATSRAQRNRLKMLDLVRHTWIEGVLEKSLHGAAMIELGMEERADAVDHPWDMILRTKDGNRPLPAGTRIVDVFEEMNEALLILGQPGAGKTTMLLELARQMIDLAEQDPVQPIPVVFNLSSWADKRPKLEDWLVDELRQKYLIPQKVAQAWVDQDDLLVLLDGLDEVKEGARQDCSAAINDFRQEHLVPLAVCSRVKEYETLTTRLKLQSAVLLQPLTLDQIDAYLQRAGKQINRVRQALADDPDLSKMTNSPLTLSILTLAYAGQDAKALANIATDNERRAHLFDAYIERMFERRARSEHKPYPKEQTVYWLAWLAVQMNAHQQSIYLIERMQPDWLLKRVRQRAVVWMPAIVSGLIFGLILGLASGLLWGLSFGLVGWLAGWLVYTLFFARNGVRHPAERLHWLWSAFFVSLRLPLVIGLVVGLGSIMGSTLYNVMGGRATKVLVEEEITTRTAPNEGIRRSLYNGLMVVLVVVLVLGLGGGLIVGLVFGLNTVLIGGLTIGLAGGLILGPNVGLLYGGLAWLQHYTLRFFLHKSDLIPWRDRDLIAFLDHACDRIFMRRVGGGYIFVHRLLQEHFAAKYDGDLSS